MPADLDQFRCEYSHRAVVGRKGLVKLSHVAADGRRFLNQVDLETRSAEIEGGLNSADPATDYQDISEITLLEALAQNIDLFFLRKLFFHFLPPHQVLYTRTNRVIGPVRRT